MSSVKATSSVPASYSVATDASLRIEPDKTDWSRAQQQSDAVRNGQGTVSFAPLPGSRVGAEPAVDRGNPASAPNSTGLVPGPARRQTGGASQPLYGGAGILPKFSATGSSALSNLFALGGSSAQFNDFASPSARGAAAGPAVSTGTGTSALNYLLNYGGSGLQPSGKPYAAAPRKQLASAAISAFQSSASPQPASTVAWGVKPNTTVFSGRKEFANTTQAYQAAFAEIYGLMSPAELAKLGPDVKEYGFEIIPSKQGKVHLGNLVSGVVIDGRASVAAQDSDTFFGFTWPKILGGGGATQMPVGHSHPPGAPSPGLSDPDVRNWLKSRPLDGKRMTGLLDFNTGQGYKVEIDKRVPVPPALLQPGGAKNMREAEGSARWLRKQVADGKLTVTLIVDFNQSGLGILPPRFIFEVDRKDGRPTEQEVKVVEVPPKLIKIAPNLMRSPQ
jgi:hypothetical protein